MATDVVTEASMCTSWRTLMEMLRDRYGPHSDQPRDLSEYSHLSPEDVAKSMSSSGVSVFDAVTAGIRIVYDLSSRFKTPSIKKLIEVPGFDLIIVVIRERPSTAAERGVTSFASVPSDDANTIKVDVELFNIKELQMNVTKHEYVPVQRPIRDEAEIDRIQKMYHAKARTSLPIIYTSDPQARYYGLKPGQLMAIERVSPSVGMTEIFRCCVKQ